MNRTVIWNFAGIFGNIHNRFLHPFQKDTGDVLMFDPAMGTDNLGDCIIMKYCEEILRGLFPNHRFLPVPVHCRPTPEEEFLAQKIPRKFVCGTNLLTSHIERHWSWQLPEGIRRKWNFRNVILLGVGWKEYESPCSAYSKMIYQCMLDPGVLHSVRDSYTEQKLKEAGLRNVINTCCPTMWRLTPEFCSRIPMEKAPQVVTTLTDYRRDPVRDQQMLDILSRNYDRVFLWLQGRLDEEYLGQLHSPKNLVLIPRSLAAYEEVLNRGAIDYVGTRLHAGIFALNHQVRSIILAVDNRAIEIGRDTGLPVILRKNLGAELEPKIQSEFQTEILLPQENIDRFLGQFHTKS